MTPAHRSGAGMVHFTFTGESFLAVAQLLEERGQQEELVGWYHTHLFGIDFDMGLSGIDVDLHLATFQRPWQVAALINIRRGRRILRFYGRGERRTPRSTTSGYAMTAEDTALRTVRWAASDMSDALPRGDLAEATRLADPGPELLLWVGRLAAVTAARLRLASPLSR